MASEEQKKELKMKLTLAFILIAAVTVIGGLGPGLEPVVLQWAKDHAEDPDAPTVMYRVAQIEEMTLRRAKAIAVYEHFYLNYCGNEAENTGLQAVNEALWGDADNRRYFMWWVAEKYDPPEETDGTNPRPKWVGGDQPHALMPKIILASAKYYEDERDYLKSKHLFHVLKHCYPGTPEAEDADLGIIRQASRSYGN